MQEDLKILEESENIGTKWAKISKFLVGRNENSVKNRYFTLLGIHSISHKKKTEWPMTKISEIAKIKISKLKMEQAQINSSNDISDCIISSYINENPRYDNVIKSPYPYDNLY